MKGILTKSEYRGRDLVLLMLRASPFYTAIDLVYRLVGAALPTLTILATAEFLSAALAIAAGEKAIGAVAIPIALLAFVMLFETIISRILIGYITCRRVIFLRNKLRPEIIGRVAALDYRHIENQDTQDLINRVAPVFDTAVSDSYSSVVGLAAQLLSSIGVIITVAASAWWAGLIILVSSVPLMFVAKKAGENSYEAQRITTKITRRAGYLSEVLKSRDAVEERTVYGYTDELNGRFFDKYEEGRKIRLRVSAWNFIKQKSGGIFGTVIGIGTVLTMIPAALDGRIEYTMFVALVGGILTLIRTLSWGVNSQVQVISEKREYLRDLTKLMELETTDGTDALPGTGMAFDRIELKNVSFSYPGTEKLILDDVSFEIERGRHYSFVGVNGAGKTTITKLLTGLYTNYTGEILIDGKPLRDLTQAELKGLSTVVYQDFARYSFSLYDNIAVGALGRPEGEVSGSVDAAAELIGLDPTIEKLPDGLRTNLGKIYENGVDLSGGEWQRVAMARSLVSNAPLRILDEPTAALDPVSESRIYSQFEQISQGKTTIFISHRLGSTKLADTIYVLADGKIKERGSHRELMDKDGVYAEMYRAQADWYAADTVTA